MNNFSVRRLWGPILVVFVFASAAPFSPGEETSPPKETARWIALTQMRIIDGRSPRPIDVGTILIEGGTIRAVGRSDAIKIPAGTQVVDLEGKTVMPGLIDLHVHATMNDEAGYDDIDAEPDVITALKAAKELRRYLDFGVTTVRDVGGRNGIPGLLAKARSLKLMTGPRYYHSGRLITNTGGHGWNMAEMVDGVDGLIRAVRARFYEGLSHCDFIKITWNLPEGYRAEEVRAAIEETHRYGKKIAVHAYQPETIHACVEYGADTIEHGWGIDPKTIPLAVEKKVIIVPTMYLMARPLYDKTYTYKGDDYEEFIAGTRKWVDMFIGHLTRYVEAGGMIALGTDWALGRADYNMPAEELIMHRELGMTPFQIIQAGTINGARALGLEGTIGTIEEGKRADLVVYEENPLDRLETIRNAVMVMLDGEIVIDKRKGAPKGPLHPASR